jgi:hypothetical protein
MFLISLWSCDNQATIKHWRSKMRVLNRETEERNRLLQEEKHSIQRHYQQLKHRIKLYRCVSWLVVRALCGVCCYWHRPARRRTTHQNIRDVVCPF